MTTRLEHIAAHAAAELRHHSELLALIADVIDELASRARLAAPLEKPHRPKSRRPTSRDTRTGRFKRRNGHTDGAPTPEQIAERCQVERSKRSDRERAIAQKFR